MKLERALLLGAATVAAAQAEQQVLDGGGRDLPLIVSNAAHDAKSWLTREFGEMTTEAKALWDEISLLVPDATAVFNKILPPKPKKASRRPDSQWDHVVKGADVQSMWVETNGQKHRKVGGRLESYNLRAKKVDPSALGIDTVKQYSGYLDDEANDKHLFYCEYRYP